MEKVMILHVPRFMNASRLAGKRILNVYFDAFFLPLPEEMNEAMRSFLLNEIEEDEIWNEYRILTGANEPMTRFLKNFFSPIINSLKVKFGQNEFDIYCYHNATTHAENANLSEEQLLLEFRCKATGKLFLDEWRQLLKKLVGESEENYYRKLLILLSRHYEPVILTYDASVRFLKEKLSDWRVKVEYTYYYWRSPMEQLLVYSMIHGVDGITKEDFEKAVKQQIDYLDFILAEKNIDIAHEKWAEKASKSLVRRRYLR
ncbi:MAG: hypothetical protein QXW47_02090 [Candidatus Jordarchaeales archaeon]|nr:hypothetical protein [Candidatus Jordarchaeia archaeon]